jgi:hypothetical protein
MIRPLNQIAFAAIVGISSIASALAATAPADQNVRGTVLTADAKSLSLTTPSGIVTIPIHAPLGIYQTQPSDLAHVKNTSFVGITSVKQADGSEVATEIHIFPEALRGTGEGSHMMDAPDGKKTKNRMTNGSVTKARTPNAKSRMTNGTVKSTGNVLTLSYGSDSRPITIPADVPVTILAPVQATLNAGDHVIVRTQKDASGAIFTNRVMLANAPAAQH